LLPQAIRTPIQLNMAACQIRMEDFHTAIQNCSQVLSQDRSNTKALFRWAGPTGGSSGAAAVRALPRGTCCWCRRRRCCWRCREPAAACHGHRRGKAKLALGQTEEALKDLEQAAKLAPEDKGVARELQLVRAELKQEARAAAKVYKSAFRALAASGEALADIGAQGQQQQGQQQRAGVGSSGAAGGGSSGGAVRGLFRWLSQLARTLQRGLLMLFGQRQAYGPSSGSAHVNGT
jgi:tetratricopeptide (TPR) repeat protein